MIVVTVKEAREAVKYFERETEEADRGTSQARKDRAELGLNLAKYHLRRAHQRRREARRRQVAAIAADVL